MKLQNKRWTLISIRKTSDIEKFTEQCSFVYLHPSRAQGRKDIITTLQEGAKLTSIAYSGRTTSYPSFLFVYPVSYVLPSPDCPPPAPGTHAAKLALLPVPYALEPASDHPQVFAARLTNPRLRILLVSALLLQQRWPRNSPRLMMRSVARSSCSIQSGVHWDTQASVLTV